jgi:SPP1 gp7 family putative phage head morphogenesis protein
MLGFLQEDSPLWERLGKLAGTNAQKVADALLEGIAFGYNPAKTARMFENVMGGGLTDAMRMTRTAQLYASREANRAMYVANDDVVEGWVWWSSLDSDTCMACAVEHGTIHSNDESMDSHYNCRCNSIPVVKGYNDEVKTGTDWFSGLSEKEQRDMMGNSAFDAWKDGKFDLADMATRRHDDVYGEMLARTPLQDLIQN